MDMFLNTHVTVRVNNILPKHPNMTFFQQCKLKELIRVERLRGSWSHFVESGYALIHVHSFVTGRNQERLTIRNNVQHGHMWLKESQ